jgi:hypothetical protein
MRKIGRVWRRFWAGVEQSLRNSDLWRRVGIGALIGAVIVGVLQAFGGDIYRNWLKPYLTTYVLPFLGQSTVIQIWQTIAVILLLATLLAYSIAISLSKRDDNRVTAAMVVELDKMTVPLVSAMEEQTDGAIPVDSIIRRLIEFALRGIMNLYGGDVYRASVLMPDPADPNWLKMYADVGHDHLSRSRKFYIGPNPDHTTRRPGVAGTVFREREPQLVHFDKSKRKPDNNNYFEFPDNTKHTYQSFVAAPLFASFLELDQEARQDDAVYGVICLDSPAWETFEKDPIKDPLPHGRESRGGKLDKRVLGAGPLLRLIWRLLKWRARLT